MTIEIRKRVEADNRIHGFIFVDDVEITVENLAQQTPETIKAIAEHVLAVMPETFKAELVGDLKDPAEWITQIQLQYLGKFDEQVKKIATDYREYAMPVAMRCLAMVPSVDKVAGYKHITTQELGYMYLNLQAALVKLVYGLKGTEAEPAMSSAAMDAVNHFRAGLKA